MEIELVDKIERLFEIEKEWSGLLVHSPVKDIFLTPQWIYSWWEIFREGKGLFTVALWEGNKLCGLFPLYKFKKGPFNIITFIGLPKHSDRMDFVFLPAYEEKGLKGFSHWISKRSDWDMLSLNNFGPFSKTPELLNGILKNGNHKQIFSSGQPCYYIATNNYKGFEDYLKSTIKPKHRRELSRLNNRVVEYKRGEWKLFDRVDDQLLDQMEELDSTRSKRSETGSIFLLNKLNKIFLKQLVAKLQSSDMIKLFAFLSDGKLYSYWFTFKYDNKILGYQPAFDKDLNSYQIGTLTMLEGIKYTFDNGCREFDFLIGDDSYKNRWTENFRQNRSLLVYNRGIKSTLLYFYQTRIKPIRSKVKNYRLVQKLVPESLKKLDI